MDRAVATALARQIRVLLGVGWLAFPATAAAQRPVVILTGIEAEAPEAEAQVLRRLGVASEDVRVLTLDQLGRQVRVVSLDRRSEDAGCGGPIWLEDWQARVREVDDAVQLLDFNGALGLVSELELEVGCLDRVPARGDLLRLHLAAASAALLASQEASATMQRFYADRLMQAAGAARGLGDDLLLPSGLDPRILRLVETIEVPRAVSVAAGGPGGRIYVDGAPVGRAGARLVPGLRLVQVLGDGGATQVSAASLYPLELPTLLFAGSLGRDQLAADLAAVGQGLPATELVRTLERLLDAEIQVADVTARGVTLRTLDGVSQGRPAPQGSGGVRPDAGLAAEREVVLSWVDRLGFGGADRPIVVGVGLSTTWTTLDDPVAGDLSGLAGGVALWFRYPTASWLTLALTAQPVARREPLPDGYDADWLYRAWVPVRAGVRVEGTLDDLRWELGVDGLLALLGPYDQAQRALPGAALAGAVTRPVIDRRFALRLAVHGAAGRHFVGGGVVVGLDSTW